MRSPRSVTIAPIGMALAQLEVRDRLVRAVTTGFWPVIARELLDGASRGSWGSASASPRPMLTTIFSSRGTCIGFLSPSSFISAGTTSLLVPLLQPRPPSTLSSTFGAAAFSSPSALAASWPSPSRRLGLGARPGVDRRLLSTVRQPRDYFARPARFVACRAFSFDAELRRRDLRPSARRGLSPLPHDHARSRCAMRARSSRRCRPRGSPACGPSSCGASRCATFSTSTRSLLAQRPRAPCRVLPLSLPRDDQHGVALRGSAWPHSTSGASEMIFMNFLARSSRATGPKMRVPIGSWSLLMRTALLASNLM